mgnify:FL=1
MYLLGALLAYVVISGVVYWFVYQSTNNKKKAMKIAGIVFAVLILIRVLIPMFRGFMAGFAG